MTNADIPADVIPLQEAVSTYGRSTHWYYWNVHMYYRDNDRLAYVSRAEVEAGMQKSRARVREPRRKPEKKGE